MQVKVFTEIKSNQGVYFFNIDAYFYLLEISQDIFQEFLI